MSIELQIELYGTKVGVLRGATTRYRWLLRTTWRHSHMCPAATDGSQCRFVVSTR